MKSAIGHSVAGGAQRYSQYQAISGVTVRDYAYHATDPRHYGLPREDGSTPSERTDSDEWSSNSSDEEDDDAASYGSAERLFESDEDNNTATHASPSRSRGHPNRRQPEVSCADMEATVLPQLASQLKGHMGDINLKFRYARAMFDFSKATEWEMSLTEGEDVLIAFVGSPEPPVQQAPSSGAAREIDTASSVTAAAGAGGGGGGDERGGRGPPPSLAERSEPDVSDSTARKKDATEDVTGSGRGLPLDAVRERWASIDCVADNLVAMAQEASGKTPTMMTLDPSDRLIRCDPPTSDLAAQLNQLLDYAGVYGTGWATALRIRCRGRVVSTVVGGGGGGVGGAGASATGAAAGITAASPSSQARKAAKSRIKVKLLDMGLVPGNYIENVQA
ncbi:hypothetical protein HKX48_000488 [Thoreauomyces humboldtii]|nr:hypothetical protein HKX48_000488 [Thoreauomyces humboldtii]